MERTQRSNRMRFLARFLAVTVAGAITACGNDTTTPAAKEAAKTGFPGQVTANGGTSGEVIAAAGKVKNTPEPSGTPGIPQGAGGNTGGAALGGTTTTSGTGTEPQAGEGAAARQAPAKE